MLGMTIMIAFLFWHDLMQIVLLQPTGIKEGSDVDFP